MLILNQVVEDSWVITGGLFAVMAVKLASQALGVLRLDIGEERGKLEFSSETNVDPIKIVNLVQRQANTYKLEGASVLRVTANLPSFDERLAFAHEVLTKLKPEVEAAA